MLWWLLWLLGNPAIGQNHLIQLSQEGGPINITERALVYEDFSASMSLEEVLHESFLERDLGKVGLSSSAFWLELQFATGSAGGGHWLLAFDFALLDSISVYTFLGDSLVAEGVYGDMVPFSRREVDYRLVTIPFDLATDSQYRVLIRVHTEAAYQMGMKLYREKNFYFHITEEGIFYGIVYGIFLVMTLYNFFVFFTLRDLNYVWYAGAIGTLAFFFACYYGHSYQYLWPDQVFFGDRATHFSMGLLAVTNATFARKFLNLKKYAKVFNIWCLAAFYLGILAAISAVTMPHAFNAVWIPNLLLFTMPAVLMGSFWAWLKGNKAARFFAVAWVPFLLGGALLMLRNFGVLPTNGFTSNSVILGATAQVVLLSLALGDRYKLIKSNQERVQAENAQLLREANTNLEQKVRERTQELQESNEELNITLETIQEQNDLIQNKNQKITDSIRYASLIQGAMLPLGSRLSKGFPQHFIYYLPRDIVSGDFYWYHTFGDQIFVGVVDCTGHGVPGALMSMIGANVLNTLVGQHGVTDPGKILSRMHHDVEKALKQEDTKNRDGMDASLVVYDPATRKLRFSGARNSLIYFQEGICHEVKADRMSIAGRVIRKGKAEENKEFKTHTIDVKGTTEFYLFTDGYKDQFGGRNGRKLMHKAFVELLGSLQPHPVEDQREMLQKHFESWTKGQDQVDDVLVMGFRIGEEG